MKADPAKLQAMRDESICPMCGQKLDTWIFDGPAAFWATYSCPHCGYQLREHVLRHDVSSGDVPKR